jgi:hypothetical protein
MWKLFHLVALASHSQQIGEKMWNDTSGSSRVPEKASVYCQLAPVDGNKGTLIATIGNRTSHL